MFGRLVLLFILVPLADLFLLMWISKFTGVFVTISLVITTGIIGAWLARHQGTFVKGQIKDRLSKQQVPADLIGDGAMIMFAAGLLLTPGLLTDILGFSFLMPACRTWYKKFIANQFKGSFNFKIFTPSTDPRGGRPVDDPNIVEGEVVDREAPKDSQTDHFRNLN